MKWRRAQKYLDLINEEAYYRIMIAFSLGVPPYERAGGAAAGGKEQYEKEFGKYADWAWDNRPGASGMTH